jgi:hypothetical protein
MTTITPSTTNTIEPTSSIEASSGFTDFVLRQLNVARLRALLAVNEIATTATALSGGLITAETAIIHLHALGLLETSSGAA